MLDNACKSIKCIKFNRVDQRGGSVYKITDVGWDARTNKILLTFHSVEDLHRKRFPRLVRFDQLHHYYNYEDRARPLTLSILNAVQQSGRAALTPLPSTASALRKDSPTTGEMGTLVKTVPILADIDPFFIPEKHFLTRRGNDIGHITGAVPLLDEDMLLVYHGDGFQEGAYSSKELVLEKGIFLDGPTGQNK